jgi:hypothetical protein
MHENHYLKLHLPKGFVNKEPIKLRDEGDILDYEDDLLWYSNVHAIIKNKVTKDHHDHL